MSPRQTSYDIIILNNIEGVFGTIFFFVIISLFILYNPFQLCVLASINLINKEI